MSIAEKLITASEFEQMPDDGRPTELVRGRIVAVNVPTPRHGEVCSLANQLVGAYVRQQDIGRVVTNDSAVITQRNPDTVRGADLAFYSFQRMPKGPLPQGYLQVAPELVFEVVSPSDRWSQIVAKAGEHLEAGVLVVCVLDPQARSIHVYRADAPATILSVDEVFSLPDILGGFAAPVKQFFE